MANKHRGGLADLAVHAEGAQAKLDTIVRGKGEAGVSADAVHECVGAFKAEQEKLRKQVHHLQAENAR